MSAVKLCRECKWSRFDDRWAGRCTNPEVNRRDAGALTAGPEGTEGSCCRDERNRISFFAPCGMKGKQWAAKQKDQQP